MAYPFSLLLLEPDVAQAFLEGDGFAALLHASSFVEPVAGVGLDLQQPRQLRGRHPEHRAANAGVLVLAGRSVGPVAPSQRDEAEAEVVAEVFPFGVGWFAVFLAGTPRPALVDEPAVVGEAAQRAGSSSDHWRRSR